MKSVLIAPGKYVQGRGVLREIGAELAKLGRKPQLLWDNPIKTLIGQTVADSLRAAGLPWVEVLFGGESTKAEAARVAQLARDHGADISVGIGGGKVLDIAKAAAVNACLKLVTVPTIASTDSPTSAATVWYDEQGDFQGFECWPFNPNLVLVDSLLIAQGPVRAFVAGMGDALSTWVEAEAAHRTRALNLAGGVSTMAAMTLARLCFDTLLEWGVEAKRTVEQKVLTPAVERVIEANVLLSGLGFESGGLATAHMIGNILSGFPECKKLMHGEKVGFGVISQLCLDEDKPFAEIRQIVDFEIAIGLPVTFADLNLAGIARDRLKIIGDLCVSQGSLCESHPFEVTSESVVDAMIAADALGRSLKGRSK
jgi:glycerol dehydrogenase